MVLAGGVAFSAQAPNLDALLTRAGAHVARFIERFSNVVAEEHYVQDVAGMAPLVTRRSGGAPQRQTTRQRELKSDFLLVKVGTFEWLPFRDVFEVDGRPIRDREERLAKLFLQPWDTALEQATQIARESARYNLGDVQRTINTPMLGLIFLYEDVQLRARFAFAKQDGGEASAVRIVDFKEEARPTLVRGQNDSDVPASGRFWIDADSGRVTKAQLDLTAVGVRARVVTTFHQDDRFGIDVPAEMQEEYYLDRGTVFGTAKYSHFRRFDVNADHAIQNPVDK